MRIGIGLPNPIPGTPASSVVEWAARAERLGFASVATIDRVAFPTHDSLACLAAAAMVTARIELMTNILLAPTRGAALLAKQAVTVDQLSGGRLTLGLAVGGRADDYTTVGRPYAGRGRAFDELLATLHAAWRGEPPPHSPWPVAGAPVRPEGIPLLIGGASERAIERTVRWGAGWTAGGSGPDDVRVFGQRLGAAWRAARRSGPPRIVALAYFALGPLARAGIDSYIRPYYAYIDTLTGTSRDRELAGTRVGDRSAAVDPVDAIAGTVAISADGVRETAAGYAAAGVDDLLLCPVLADLRQIDRLARAVL